MCCRQADASSDDGDGGGETASSSREGGVTEDGVSVAVLQHSDSTINLIKIK